MDCAGAECATIEVPLDYDDPGLGRVELSVTVVPATGEEIGSLVVNPGGPGGSAIDYARAADYVLGKPVREVYNIVGIDPRGVGLSDPIRCLSDRQIDELTAADGTPDSPDEIATIDREAVIPAQECSDSQDALVARMGTLNVARDFDIVRAVLDEPVLNMLGKSYGTAVATAYIALFPEHAGRMVLDGVLATDRNAVEVTFDQAVAFEVMIEDFLAFCQEDDGCPFTTSQQLRDFLAGLDTQPLPTSDDRVLTESLATFAVLSYLYFPETDYPLLAQGLQEAVEQKDGTTLLELLDERRNRAPDGRYLDNSTDAYYAVTCVDLPFEGTAQEVEQLAQEWAGSAPTFGPALAWGLLVCRDWPGAIPAQATAALPPLPTPRTPPLIVVSANDPATPASWGEDLAQRLPTAELVIWDSHFGHTAYQEGSGCVDKAVDAYLVAGDLPAANPLVCRD